jgi:hypothetical protein
MTLRRLAEFIDERERRSRLNDVHGGPPLDS